MNHSTKAELIAFYETQIMAHNIGIQKLKKLINWLAILRALVFISALLCIYQYFNSHIHLFVLLFIFFVILFFGLVAWHIQKKQNKQLLENKLRLAQNEWNIINGKENEFENGNEFLQMASYAADLDIFGSNSLFHTLNRTVTLAGKLQLAKHLSNTILDKKTIIAYQEALKAYSNQYPFIENWIATALLHKKEQNQSDLLLKQWVVDFKRMKQVKYYNIIRWVLPAYTLTALYLALDSGQYLLLSIGIVLNWIHVIRAKNINIQAFQFLSKNEEIIAQYHRLVETFQQVQPGNSYILQELKNSCRLANKSFQELAFITNLIHQQHNLLASTLLNSLLMIDVHSALSLNKWHTNYSLQFPKWIDSIADIDYLNTMAIYAHNHSAFVYAQFNDGELFISAKNMAHPLLPEDIRVPNSFTFNNKGVRIITGSNMSGKSTFLRTVGVNVLLAQMGAPVCADEFLLSPMYIFSCIRITDSLQENHSYFMAELQRLYDIKTSLSNHYPALVLMDEILRGTNSADKFEGSTQFLEQMMQLPCIVLFATHDLKLSTLEKNYPGRISNFCFESTIADTDIHFDYILREGVAQNKNATFLMKKMGII
jgi:DNA mismatch repair ATPase MutS